MLQISFSVEIYNIPTTCILVTFRFYCTFAKILCNIYLTGVKYPPKTQCVSKKDINMNLSDIKRQTGAIFGLLVRFKTNKLQISFSNMKISVKLDKRYRLANGKYPVKLSVARNGRTFYVPLNIEVREEDWDINAKNMEYIRNVPNRKSLNLHIRGELSNAEQLIRDLQLKGKLRDLDDKQLQRMLSIDSKERDNAKLLKYHAEKFIAERRTEGTKETYETALKAFARHYDYDTFLLEDFSKQMIMSYIQKLQNEGLKQNTISSYISHLRVIYKYAYTNGSIDKPFPYIISKHQRTTKRNLLVEQLRSLMQFDGLTARQRLYIDVFMLIFYMRGINMKDLSELPADAIRNGRILYDRDKTGKPYEIKVEPEMLEIIRRYQGKEHLLRFFDGHKPSFYKNFGNCMRQTLRNAASRVGLSEPLSAYWARHSWATIAIELGASMEMVSAGLGHSIGEQVTQVYVAFRQKQVDELASKVIDFVLQKGEYSINKSK